MDTQVKRAWCTDYSAIIFIVESDVGRSDGTSPDKGMHFNFRIEMCLYG